MSDGDILYRGYWWLPDDEANKEPGVLRIRSDGRAMLELVNGLSRRIWEQSPDNPDVSHSSRHTDYWPMVYGQSSSSIFTLLDVSFAQSSGPIWGTKPANEDLRVSRTIKDVWLESPDEPAFSGVQVDLDFLLEWSGMSAYKIQLEWQNLDGDKTDPATMKSIATSRIPESMHAQWRDYRFKLRVFHNTLDFKMEGPNSRLVAGRERAALDIECDTPQSLETFDELITTFQNLLTLAENHPSAIRTVHFRLPVDEGQRDQGYQSFRGFIYGSDSKPYKQRYSEHMFHLDDEHKFEDIVPNWYDLAEQIKDSSPLIFSSHYLDEGYVGAQLMTLCAAIESLHRELFDRPNELPEVYDAFMAHVLEGVPEERHQSIKERLGNGLSYHNRLLDLLDQAAPRAVDYLVSDREMWIKQVKTGRNALAHNSGSQAPEMQAFLLLVSRTFCQLVLGQAIGISPDQQLKFVQGSQQIGHQARTFKTLLSLPNGVTQR